MPSQKHLFDRVVNSGVYIDLVSIPSRRNSANSQRYEVFNAKGDLLGKGRDQQQALDAAWVKFSQVLQEG